MNVITFIRKNDDNQGLGICDTIISRQIFNVLILSVKCVPIYPMIVSKCGRKFD